MHSFPFDHTKFEAILQVGGISTGTMDYPNPLGSHGSRIAQINTGGGLRLTIALDRGGDIVEASFKETNLAFLTPNGHKPPNPAYHQDFDWLSGWPGGLLTTCGPEHMGGPREEDGRQVSLHGRYSNTPAAVAEVCNPDPALGDPTMCLSLVIRDTRMFGPNLEVRRQFRATLGQSLVELHDQVVNVSDQRCPHSYLYHVNLGYPFLDAGARLIFQGTAAGLGTAETATTTAQLEELKTVPSPMPSHAGTGEGVLVMDVPSDPQGITHVGLINDPLNLALELCWPAAAMPRFANWQHFGPRGSYVTGLEPYSGTLLGKAADDHPSAEQWLQPGESKAYQLTIRVHDDEQGIESLRQHDGPLHPK